MSEDHKKLDEKTKLKMQASPMVASVHWNFDDDTEEDITRWFDEFNKLELLIRYGLLSEKTRDSIFNITKKYNIYDKERMGEISRIIREIFTKHISEEDIIKRVIEKLKINQDRVNEFMTDLKNIIILVKKEGQRMKDEEDKSSKDEMMAIGPAMEKYKEIGEQLISLEPIKLEIFRESVRPSIKNWLEDYRETMGTEKSSIKRSNYLFTSENAKGLNPEDRKKVSLILKSYNDNTGLVINSREKKVNFEMSLKQRNGEKKQLKNNYGFKKEDDIFVDEQKSNNLNFNNKAEVDVPGMQKGEQNSKQKTLSPEALKQYEDKKSDEKEKRVETKKKPNNLLDLSEY